MMGAFEPGERQRAFAHCEATAQEAARTGPLSH